MNHFLPLRTGLALGAALALAATSLGAPPTSYKQLKYPPMNPIRVPEPVRFEMPNGIVVYLVEDHELPVVDIATTIRVGARWEPADKAGLASILGTVMRTGGTPTRNGDALDEELDRLGASVETGIGEDSGGASVAVLKEDLDRGIEILADLLQHPALPEEKIELARIAARDGIARRNDDPGGIVDREFGRVIFGKDSPYGRQAEYDTVNGIQRADLAAFHQQYFQPENVVLGAWGDFKADELRAKLEKAFGGWARGGKPKPIPPPTDPAASQRAGVYVVNKEDVNQSTVMMGYLGGQRSSPDYYALAIMSRILGGGFASRLFSNVRSEQGLAYSVYASWAAGWDRPGLFLAGGATKSESTAKIIQSIRREIARMTEAEPSEAELTLAKDGILKGFAFEFDSVGKIVRRLLNYEYYGYPRDYLQRFQENIGKVTRADVLRVARQYLKPADLAIVVLGKEKDFDQPMSSLGKATTLDIAIPPPKTEKPAAATPETRDKGRALLVAAREAMGAAAVLGLKSRSSTADATVTTPQAEFALKVDSLIAPGAGFINRIAAPFGELVTGFDGQIAWRKTPQGIAEVSGPEKEELLGSYHRETATLLREFEQPGWEVQALGPGEVGGKAVEFVSVNNPARGVQVKFGFDTQSHLPLSKSYRAAPMGTPGNVEEIASDFREVGGLKVPFQALLKLDGQKFGEARITDFKVNVEIKDGAFKMPQN